MSCRGRVLGGSQPVAQPIHSAQVRENDGMNRPLTGNATSGKSLRLFWLLLLATVLTASSGCLIPMYSGDPIRRAQQLIYTSEDLRAITDEWERIWFLDQPSHMTPYRTHGGVL